MERGPGVEGLVARGQKGRFDQGSWFKSVARSPHNKNPRSPRNKPGEHAKNKENDGCDPLLSWGKQKPQNQSTVGW